MRRHLSLLLAATVLCALGVERFAALRTPSQDVTPLESGVPYEGTLQLDPFSLHSQEFSLEVPEDAVAMWIELTCNKADLDLYVTDPESEDYTFQSESETGVEWLLIDRGTEPELRAGTHTIEVYCFQNFPRWENRRLNRVDFQLRATVIRARVDGQLQPGVPVSGTLDFESGGFRTFTIEVPEDAPALRLDLIEAPGDLDLYARRKRPILRQLQASHIANQHYGRESLLISRTGVPRLRPGLWYVDVIAFDNLRTSSQPFTLRAGFETDVPAELHPIPALPRPEGDGPLETALCSVVDLYTTCGGGSGTLLTEQGVLLTNAHVVADYGEEPVEQVVIAATLDRQRSAVELFRGKVVEFDMRRDLALVRIESGLYGQPLPADYRFPILTRGDSTAVGIGDPMWMIGYPKTGARGERPLLSATRGILCGYSASPFGAFIKSDAEISSGNSGGAAIDATGRLIAVPTEIVEDGSGQLAHLVPIEQLPEAWERWLK